MSKIKIVSLLAGLTLLLAVLVSTFWVEFWLIPQLLAKAGYQNAVVVHVIVILLMLVTTAGLASRLTRHTIFSVQEKLVSLHLNNLTSAIANVVSGAWNNQANVEKSVFMAGARLGYDVRDALPPPDRGQVLSGLAAMELPQPKQLTGESPDVIEGVNQYMDSFDQRRQRLSL